MTFLSTGNGMAGYSGVHRPLKPALPFFLAQCVRHNLCLLFFFLLFAGPGAYSAEAQSIPSLPVIIRLDTRDIAFRQYQQDVEASRRLIFSSRQNLDAAALAQTIVSSMTIYSYTPREGEDLFGIAARCNIPYGTLASLNRLSNQEDMLPGRVLLLPSAPGIFISETPGTSLERLIYSSRAEYAESQGLVLTILREGRNERFRFVPGGDFSPTERVFFFNRGFNFPLQNYRITSSFGYRINPVTGRHGMHHGLDLAAPEGSDVSAARSGTVIAQGEDTILGKYIIIAHDNDWTSLYGHLSEINTVLRQEVQSATLIGKVGATGQTTGPHLHFELRQSGQSQDPARLLRSFRGNTGQ